MKKILILLFIVFVSSELSFGQFALGVKLGYNASKLTTDVDSIKSDFNSGFHAGVFTRIGKRIYFAPELLYTLSGGVFTEEGSVSTDNWKQKVTVGTMDIPLLLGIKVIHSDLITWRIELGPEASFVINKKITEKGSLDGPITTADISTANWYILAGTGIDVLFLSLDIRYQYGLNAMIKDVQNTSFNSQGSLILVSLGFKIFGKK
jgi:hypothetical protein